MLMDHQTTSHDGQLTTSGVARGGLASRQRHVAAPVLPSPTFNVMSPPLPPTALPVLIDINIAARTSGLGVARGELHFPAVCWWCRQAST